MADVTTPAVTSKTTTTITNNLTKEHKNIGLAACTQVHAGFIWGPLFGAAAKKGADLHGKMVEYGQKNCDEHGDNLPGCAYIN